MCCSFNCFKTLLSFITIFTLLYLYISQKILNNIAKYRENNDTTYKFPPVTININRIKKFYEKDGAIFIPSSLKQIDWHNYTQIEDEGNRTGTGEQGKAAHSSTRGFWMQQIIDTYGYNTDISEKIALNRSLQDLRPEGCKERLYLESLPTVSVIVVFYNEHFHTLLRTVVSVLNRSPEHLIKEVFLVDNASTEESNKEELDKYVQENMTKVKVVRLKNSTGLAAARLTGAKLATADILLFLDSHTEVTINWLPPLLEPIALDYRTSVVPHINEINYSTFEYLQNKYHRGIFNGTLYYMRVPITPKDKDLLPEPFDTPVMWGMFAISRAFFWELGGYDPGFDEKSGEQFELSFKIWQCGGRLLEVPCSHVGYITPNEHEHIFIELHEDYPAKNHRRIAEVWMDEYAEYLYARRPEYRGVDPGDLTEQKALRQRLKCKPHKWFMTQLQDYKACSSGQLIDLTWTKGIIRCDIRDNCHKKEIDEDIQLMTLSGPYFKKNIAFDLTQQFPLVEPPSYAEGRIRPKSTTYLCIDGNYGKFDDVVELKPCHREYIEPKYDEQQFIFTWYNDVMLATRKMCLDIPDQAYGMHMSLFSCHHRGGNQEIRYLQETGHLLFKFDSLCLDHNPKNRDLFAHKCDNGSETQVWVIDFVNKKQLDKWNVNNTVRVTAPIEEWKED